MQKLIALFFFIVIIILVTSVQSNIQIQKFKRLHVCGLEGLVKHIFSSSVFEFDSRTEFFSTRTV